MGWGALTARGVPGCRGGGGSSPHAGAADFHRYPVRAGLARPLEFELFFPETTGCEFVAGGFQPSVTVLGDVTVAEKLHDCKL